MPTRPVGCSNVQPWAGSRCIDRLTTAHAHRFCVPPSACRILETRVKTDSEDRDPIHLEGGPSGNCGLTGWTQAMSGVVPAAPSAKQRVSHTGRPIHL